MAKKSTVLIVYPCGGYGSFLHWCLSYFSGEIDINTTPFTPNGSAHRFDGIMLRNVQSTTNFLNSDIATNFVRSHAMFDKEKNNNQFFDYISYYQNYFEKLVLITQDSQSHLMILHNSHTKTIELTYDRLLKEIINNYKNRFGATDPVPRWQLREMISYFHESYHCYINDIYQPVYNKQVVNVPVRELVDNFESTLTGLFDQLDIPMVRTDLVPDIKHKWLSLQRFVNIDHVCQQILTATVNGNNLEWQTLSIFDEAWIQWQLRNNKLEIRCDGLDKFPTNSLQLRELLYPV
jgi:hypothetical protein